MFARLKKNFIRAFIGTRIGARLIAFLLAAGVIGVLVVIFFIKNIIYSRLNQLETTQIQHQGAQISAYLENQKTEIKTKTFGWSYWDDSYAFIENFNQNFIDRNLDPASLIDYGVSSISYLRETDNVSYSVAFDKNTLKPDALLAKKMVEYLRDVIRHGHMKDLPNYETYLRIDSKLYVVGTAKVFMSDKTGTPKGIMAIARQIDDNNVKDTLKNDTIVDFVRANSPLNVKIYDDYAAISVGIFGHDNMPVGRLTSRYDRSLNAVKTDLWLVLVVGILLLSAASIIFFYGRIAEIVITPLQSLTKHLAEISKSGQLKVYETDQRNDEIGQVINSFNEMIVNTAALQESLSQKSFQIGKAQSEIDVLHNVKNALSPISTILSRLDETPEKLSNNYDRAIEELALGDCDPQRRRKLADFAKAHLKAQIETAENSARLISKARESINHAVETIDSLRANQAEFEDEFCEITSILDKSLEIARLSKDQVNVEFVKPPPQLVRGSKIIYSQVFDNLVTNALEAISQTNRKDGSLIVEIMPNAGEFENMLAVKINDNGDGIDETQKTKLFERGFSTRRNKKGGLGLHWCANNVNAMGGKLMIESEGKQKGAQVIVEIPIAA